MQQQPSTCDWISMITEKCLNFSFYYQELAASMAFHLTSLDSILGDCSISHFYRKHFCSPLCCTLNCDDCSSKLLLDQRAFVSSRIIAPNQTHTSHLGAFCFISAPTIIRCRAVSHHCSASPKYIGIHFSLLFQYHNPMWCHL